VDGAVNHVAGVVDTQALRVVYQFTVDIDLDQVRRGDFIEQQAEGVDQEMLLIARHSGRKVGVDVIGPAQLRGQAIGSRELDAHFPFLGRDTLA
jgi:hypothetical protein